MNGDIIAGVLALVGTLAGTFGGILTSTKLTNYRIEQLEKRVEAHNNLVEKVYRLEDNDKLFEEKIKVCNNRIKDLEDKVMK